MRAVAGGPPVSDAGRSAPTNADGSVAGGDQHVDEPAGGRALAVRPGDADQRPPDGRVGDDLLPRLDAGSRPSRAAASSGWSGSTAVSALVTASRSGRGAAVTWAAACSPAIAIPSASSAGVYGRRPARVAAGDDRAGVRRQEGRGARPGPGRADDVDPLPGADRPGRPGRREARPRSGPAAEVTRRRGRPSRSRRCRSSERARGRPPRSAACCSARSPVQSERRTAAPDRVGDRDVGQPDRLGRVRRPGPAIPVTDTARSAPGPRPAAARPSPARPGPTPRRARRGRRRARRPPRA